MATEADVTVGSRWRWVTGDCFLPDRCVGMTITIAVLRADGLLEYLYDDGKHGSRSASVIARHAELIAPAPAPGEVQAPPEAIAAAIASSAVYQVPLNAVTNTDSASPPKPQGCAPGCTPASPCLRWDYCPGHVEREIVTTRWFERQGRMLRWQRDVADERFSPRPPSPPPDLRCDRELACPLYRGTR